METLICQLKSSAQGVSARISRVIGGRLAVMEGIGACVTDAMSEALQLKSICFESDDDEVRTCVAAMRHKSLRIEVRGRNVRSCDLI